MSTINGYDNEYEFVKYFNNKVVKELDPTSHDLITTIFNLKSDDSLIKCWRNHLPQKADILIKIEDHIKGVSIKKGIKNSVHAESIVSFSSFLKKLGISEDIIDEYKYYHYADGTKNGTGDMRYSGEWYKNNYPEQIQRINDEFNKPDIILAAADRFIITGTNGIYPISALIYGEANDYIWISANDIKKILLSKKDLQSSGVHIGSLQVQPQNRCLNKNPLYEKDRNKVQIKWYNLLDNYLEYSYFKTNNIVLNNY